MKENFWGKMSDEYLKNNPEPPPLTDEVLTQFERRTGLKLPKEFIDLLRIKNGGLLQNTDFRFHDKEYQVTYMKAVSPDASYGSIKSYESILSDPDSAETRNELQRMAGSLAKLLYFAEPLGYPFGYVLNYNKLNSRGEPTICCIELEFGEHPTVKPIADSFAEFLSGQYSGDEKPIVDLNEAARYPLLAEGGYSGTHEISGNRVEIKWKLCRDESHFLVFQEEDWGFGKTLTRMKFSRSQIQESSEVLDFLFGLYQRFLLWRTGKEIGANLSQLANTKKIQLSKDDFPVQPRCFSLRFHTHTLGDELTDDSWIRIRTTESFEGRWKNSESKVWNSAISSARKDELEQAQKALLRNLL